VQLTVEKTLQLDILSGARVLAGRSGLSRQVSSVTVGEVPDIADWLSGGELVLSTMFALEGDHEAQRAFCARLMNARAAALFVKTTRFVKGILPEVLELAEARSFPIVEVQTGVRWTRVMQEVTAIIINYQASLLERSASIHHALLSVVMRGGGWQELVDEASRLVETPIVVLDDRLKVLAASPAAPFPAEGLEEGMALVDLEYLGEIGQEQKMIRMSGEGFAALSAVPIVVGHRRMGWVCALAHATELYPVETTALEQVATIACLEMIQDQVRLETETRLTGDIFDDVIFGRMRTEGPLFRRAAAYGCDLSEGGTVMLVEVGKSQPGIRPVRGQRSSKPPSD
jgi:PucR family transcriptional regulator, purine catabolism regulatory protein